MSKFELATVLNISGLDEHLSRVDKDLIRAVANSHTDIKIPALRLIRAGGKRLRPALAIGIAARGDRQVSQSVIAGAAAIELVHIATVVHDDIIDKSLSRWGQPTVNSEEGLDVAILVGDYLLAKACEYAAGINAEAAALIASTIADLCDGQSQELADRHNPERTVASLLGAISGKTASLMSAACQMGGICAGLPKPQIQSLGNYGQHFGMSYQLIDDVLDLLSSPSLANKPVGTDAREGVYTMPVLLALSGGNEAVLKCLKAQKPDQSDLVDVLLSSGYIAQTIQAAKKYNQLAVRALGTEASGLSALPQAYLDWSLHNQVAPKYRTATEAML